MFKKIKMRSNTLYRYFKVQYFHASQERVSNIAYNIVNGKCTPIHDESAPVYITIGDGGNQKGLATGYSEYCSLIYAFTCSIN